VKSLDSLEFLENSRIFITGGTGSLGKKLIRIVLDNTENTIIVIYSRDEYKQFHMKQTFTAEENDRLRYFIGDVRDGDRLLRTMTDVDYVIHAAALKQVDTAEYNPEECTRTNVTGAGNVINASIASNVKGVVALSTDKACAPINLYGATKLVSDKLFVAANNIRGKHAIKFSVVRYGNVMGSRGSVIPFFINQRAQGVLPITDDQMTRFNITLEQGAELVLYALKNHLGGEIFIRKLPSYRILDVAKAIAPNCRIKIVGIRPGEKLHEEMIASTDSCNSIDLGNYYATLSSASYNYTFEDYLRHHQAQLVPKGFSYNSEENTEWETTESIREKICRYVDPDFNPA